MKKLISFRYLLSFIYFVIAMLNWTKLDAAWRIDDQNLLIYFTSPPLWAINDIHKAFDNIQIFYLLSLIIWFVIGFFIDWLMKKISSLFTNQNPSSTGDSDSF